MDHSNYHSKNSFFREDFVMSSSIALIESQSSSSSVTPTPSPVRKKSSLNSIIDSINLNFWTIWKQFLYMFIAILLFSFYLSIRKDQLEKVKEIQSQAELNYTRDQNKYKINKCDEHYQSKFVEKNCENLREILKRNPYENVPSVAKLSLAYIGSLIQDSIGVLNYHTNAVIFSSLLFLIIFDSFWKKPKL